MSERHASRTITRHGKRCHRRALTAESWPAFRLVVAGILALLSVSACSAARSMVATPQSRGEAPITGARLKAHMSVLSADDVEGRETGTPGFDRAAAYVADVRFGWRHWAWRGHWLTDWGYFVVSGGAVGNSSIASLMYTAGTTPATPSRSFSLTNCWLTRPTTRMTRSPMCTMLLYTRFT